MKLEKTPSEIPPVRIPEIEKGNPQPPPVLPDRQPEIVPEHDPAPGKGPEEVPPERKDML